ncbi:MAG: SRPBCC family protein [Oceanospirillaceae bacterium]|nr:SRPBCC family protein [Oceanospirillaceae bacterium]
MKVLTIILAGSIITICTILLIGWLLPIKHTANRSLLINAELDQVWHKISDYSVMPEWRIELEKVTQISAGVWQELSKSGDSIEFETIQSVPQQRLVRKIVGENLLFGGSWTFEISRQGDKTQIKITENGEVYNVIFRFVAKFMMGYHRSMDTYLEQLQASFNPSSN